MTTSGLKVRLSVMMLIQYAIWGVWAPILALHLGDLESFRDDTNWKINLVYMTMAIASMVSPVIAGQLADRFFATEKFLAFSHLMGGLTLIWAAQLTGFVNIFWVMMLHALFYAPTVPLTNSLSFAHLPDGEKDFGKIRLWGTIGWILAGLGFSGWLGLPDEVTSHLPALPSVGDCLTAGGILSFVMAVFCLTLPHTPPTPKVERPFAFLSAFKLARDRSFAVLLLVAFLVSTELQFYYVLTPKFFGDQSGLSLSQTQLIQAAGLEGADAAEKATLLMRQLDKNQPRDQKLSREELEEAPVRLTELEAVHVNLREEGGPADLDRIRQAVREAEGITTEQRSVDDVAQYVLTAADTDQDRALGKEELGQFIDKVRPLQPAAARALAAFPDHATDRGGLSLSAAWVPRIMLLGQIMEILVLLILPFALARLGFGVTIAIGIAAWAVRYAIFSLGDPRWLVIASQTLHGFGFGFFFVGAMIYADRVAPKDIRASAQGLIIFVTYGAGMVVSSLFAGRVADYFDSDWHKIFLVPVAITTVCTILFLIGFRERAGPIEPEEVTPGEQKEGPEVA